LTNHIVTKLNTGTSSAR